MKNKIKMIHKQEFYPELVGVKENESKKDKLLNKLIDEIGLISMYAIYHGLEPYKISHDKKLALHKTKAFKIIERLRKL